MLRRIKNASICYEGLRQTDIQRLRLARYHATRYRSKVNVCRCRVPSRRRTGGQHKQSVSTKHDIVAWSPHLKALLEGVHDDRSPVSMLRGLEDTIIPNIYEFCVGGWTDAVALTYRSCCYYSLGAALTTMPNVSRKIAFAPCVRVTFPAPRNRNVNMLPFILGDVNSLPENLREYYYMIVMKCPLQASEIGKVVYLTVHEGLVEAGTSQRRAGLHIESPRHTDFLEEPSYSRRNMLMNGWGDGRVLDDEIVGGLYMASTVNHSCRVYHALVDTAAVDSHGGLDYLRHMIPSDTHRYDMKANEVLWMTDRTPHEVVPQAKSEYRQFFRLVTSSLSIWNAAHNTPNPRVLLPRHVKVVHDSRFTPKRPALRNTSSTSDHGSESGPLPVALVATSCHIFSCHLGDGPKPRDGK